MPSDKLVLTSFKGTARECGVAYGRTFERSIMGFCSQATRPNKKKLAYARRCWPHIESAAPTSAQFIRGVAAGAHLSLEHITLLTLHEEIVRLPHCTAFVASGQSTHGGRTINAMNWDWSPSLFSWPGLLKLQVKGTLRPLTYHYPVLWAAAGINEAGLSLMWTSSGTYPMVPYRVGLPTYVLMAEILRRKTVGAALRYMQRVRNAGSFNFLLGDADGDKAVVEAIPGRFCVDRSAQTLVRANHYMCGETIRRSRQRLGRKQAASTTSRHRQMAELLGRYHTKLSPSAARKILTDRSGSWPWIHQFPDGPDAQTLNVMTIDSLIAVSQDRVLHTCRGSRKPGRWQALSL